MEKNSWEVEKTDGGHRAVNGAALVMAAVSLLKVLAPLAGAIKQGFEDAPRGSLPCIGLDHGTLAGFAVIFQRADALYNVLKEACEACNGAEGDEGDVHGLADMEVAGRS